MGPFLRVHLPNIAAVAENVKGRKRSEVDHKRGFSIVDEAQTRTTLNAVKTPRALGNTTGPIAGLRAKR